MGPHGPPRGCGPREKFPGVPPCERPWYHHMLMPLSIFFRWVHPSLCEGMSVRRSVGQSVRRSDGRSVTCYFFGLLGATNAVYTALFLFNQEDTPRLSQLAQLMCCTDAENWP